MSKDLKRESRKLLVACNKRGQYIRRSRKLKLWLAKQESEDN